MEIMKKWLENTIIDLNLCPFAKVPFKAGKVQIIQLENTTLESAYEKLLMHLESFKEKDSTDLVFFKNLKCSFEDFYDISLELEEHIEKFEQNSIQVVCFHPEFRFEGVAKDSRANFVNRSPYPTIHFLHSKEFENLNLTTEEAQEISLKNEEKLNQLDSEEFKKYFFYLR